MVIFDHVGSLKELAVEWDVPVFAHYLETPYLNGRSGYPPADPTAGGGLLSLMSWMYPSSPVNISHYLVGLPENGRVPGLPEWKYLHTPGHSPGHISLFRESDNVLIAGDAFVTTHAESAFSTIFQTREVSGPPRYFTCDWVSAKDSIKKLTHLEPEIAVTGHGQPMQGEELRNSLHNLSEHFYELAVPANGRYTYDSAITNGSGVVHIPINSPGSRSFLAKALSLTALSAVLCLCLINRNKKARKYKEALAYEVW